MAEQSDAALFIKGVLAASLLGTGTEVPFEQGGKSPATQAAYKPELVQELKDSNSNYICQKTLTLGSLTL